MHCPFCGDLDTKVIDSRLVAEGDSVRRRRECLSCGERFTTFETAELVMPHLIKRDGRREPFDEDKLRYGLSKALEKRPVSVDAIEETARTATMQGRNLQTCDKPPVSKKHCYCSVVGSFERAPLMFV